MKKVAILNIGQWGIVSRSEYDDQADFLEKKLKNNGVDAEIIKEIPAIRSNYSSFIFLTRGMLETARDFRREFPEKTTILFTGLILDGDEREGVIPIWKGDWNAVEEIIELVR